MKKLKQLLHAMGMCQSMFCSVPCPYKGWDEEARDQMLLFLPVVGLEIGAVWMALAWILRHFAVHPILAGAALCACPFLLTGYIHLDGFMDVTDAVKSWRSLERRREILKDSHVGSFSVIACILLMIGQFASFASADPAAPLLPLLLIPAVSRCGSSLAIKILPPMQTSQYASRQRKASHIAMLCVLLTVFVGLGFAFGGKYGCVNLGVMAGYALALRRAYKSLEGMNGDISGYALTIAELCGAAVWALL